MPELEFVSLRRGSGLHSSPAPHRWPPAVVVSRDRLFYGSPPKTVTPQCSCRESSHVTFVGVRRGCGGLCCKPLNPDFLSVVHFFSCQTLIVLCRRSPVLCGGGTSMNKTVSVFRNSQPRWGYKYYRSHRHVGSVRCSWDCVGVLRSTSGGLPNKDVRGVVEEGVRGDS